MKKTESAIVDFYQSQELDDDKLSLLLKESRRVRGQSWRRKVFPLSAAASLLTLLIIGSMYFSGAANDASINVVLQEASVNHKNKLQLDFKSQELPDLAKVMNKLDFPLLLPESVRQQFQLLGGRYCTLNGNLAAHIRFNAADDDGEVSLFMTQNRKELLALANQSEDIDGVNISTWVADGMFYVLAAN